MPRYMNDVNMLGNKLQNALIDPVASDPGTPGVSQLWFNTGAGGDGQGRLKIKLSTRTMILDDQYVGSVAAGGTPNGISIGGTALAPTISMLLASGSQVGAMATADYTLLHTATNAATANALVQRDSSGNAAFNQLSITNAPVNSTDVVNKAYADATAAGFDPKGSVVISTNIALPSNVYANGTAGVGATLTASANGILNTSLLDGTSVHTLAVNDYVLIKNEGTAANNGIYSVTSLGSAGSKWILTRATNFNTAASGPGLISNGAFTSVEQGALAGTMWMVSGLLDAGLTVGTTAITFSSFGASQVYTAGAGLSLGANSFSVNLTGVNTLETSAGALRVKSNATTGQPLLSGGTGNEAAYGALNLAGGASFISGILPKANGGTGVDNSSQLQNLFFASPNGATGAAAYRALVAADLPTSGIGAGGTYTKVTVDTYGRVTAQSTLAATDIPALDFAKITTGIVPLTQGGTGLNLTALQNAPTTQHLPARVVATSNTSISAPGTTIDGVTMAAGDRVLLTAQSTASQNGLWVWNSSGGAMTRPLDFPAGGTLQAFFGVTVAIFAGTAGSGSEWYLSTAGAITIDTTSLAFTQFATNLGTLTGSVPVLNGGTGATTAAAARTNLGAAGAGSGTITGNGVQTSFLITTGLTSTNTKVIVTDPTANNEEVFPNIQYTSSTTATLIFSPAPANGASYGWRAIG